jgi:hypothetical protein
VRKPTSGRRSRIAESRRSNRSSTGLTKAFFYSESIDLTAINRTAITAPLFNYLAPSESADERVVTLIFISWNPLSCWLRQNAALKRAA